MQAYNLLYLLYQDIEKETAVKKIGGSVPGRDYDKDRNRELAHSKLMNLYFKGDSNRVHKKFRRRYRMRRNLFLRITEDIQAHDPYFVQKRDATGRLGISTTVKVTAAMRQLAYGLPADALDEILDIGESTALECLKRFCRAIVEMYDAEYLRRPTQDDVNRLLAVNGARGFPGMLGSIDCMHWEWKNCPKADHGEYTGRGKKPTIVLEAVASNDLWIWHAFFGLPGSMNDLNVLSNSDIFTQYEKGEAPDSSF